MKISNILEILKEKFLNKSVEVFQCEVTDMKSGKWTLVNGDYRDEKIEQINNMRAIIPISGLVVDVLFDNDYDDKIYILVIETENKKLIQYQLKSHNY